MYKYNTRPRRVGSVSYNTFFFSQANPTVPGLTRVRNMAVHTARRELDQNVLYTCVRRK